MKIYISSNYTRREYLVANSIHKEHSWGLGTFDIKDIYEIAFNKLYKTAIVLEDTKTQFDDTQQFLEEFVKSNQNKTKLILLSDTSIKHPNIFCLPSSSYKLFNEYYQPKIISTNQFVLCRLDTTNHKRNIVLENILYPNNKEIAVRLVGHPGIQHIQNVGIVSEDQMLDLILSCSLYINISNEYIYDAILYNKRILSSVKNEYISSTDDNLELKDVMNLLKSDHKNYEHNLKQYKISNIIKSIVKL